MKIYKLFIKIVIFFLIILSKIECARSIFRPQDPFMPEIITNWCGENKCYNFKDPNLEEEAIFKKFDYKYLMDHRLPSGFISYRNKPEKKVLGKTLNQLAENLISELYQKKSKFENFIILKSSDFNRRAISGNLVLRYKDYPFVLKLFMETPESFTRPFSKGWQPACFFLMSGGINRFLSGFTRIKNLEWIKNKVKESKEYADILDFPRKWFFIPKNTRWFVVTGKNITKPIQSIKLPSIYGIVADAIDRDKNQDLLKKNPKFGLKLSYYLNSRLDPNVENFMVEKGTGKIVVIDTEHFPSMVGLKSVVNFKSYTDWYLKLAFKCLRDRLTRHKKFRRDIQMKPIPTIEL